MKKRVLSLLLAFIMLLGVMPTAFAAEGDVAMIGTTGYSSLAAAIADVQDGDTITLADGTYKWDASWQIQNKSVTFSGSRNAVIDMQNVATGQNTSGAELTFNGVTLQFARDQYQGFQHTDKVVFNNCALSGRQTLYAPTVAFTNCELTHKSTTSVWTYGASDVKFADCTFNTGGRAVQIYNESTGFTANVSFTDCTFNSDGTDSNKNEALVELNRVEGSNNEYELTFTNCMFDVTKDEGRKIWGNSSGNMVDESYTVTIDGEEVTVPNYEEKKAIKDAAEETKDAIEELSYLSEKRKAELKEAVDAAAEEAKANIDDADDKEAAVDAGLDAIADIMAQAEKENKAIIALGHTVIFGGVTYGFADIDGHWAEDGIMYCYREGLMNGVGDDKFAPEAATTRGMIMTILARMSGENTAYSYPWYQAGMEWAVWNGVSDGTNPEGVITREQLAAMLWRYVGSPETAGSLTAFGDADSVSDYAVDAMTWAVEEGLINGINDNLLPQGNATRAQVATIFMCLCRNVLFF